jgi:single-strand DNA-binding protein
VQLLIKELSKIMNKAIVIGNLTRDPELKTTANGVSVCVFTLAVNRRRGEKNEVDFLPIVTWRGLAENCAKFLAKGRKAGVSGRIQTRSYEAGDGTKRYVTEIIADDVEFLSPKGDSSSGSTYGSADEQLPGDPEAYDNMDEFEPLDDEHMPF